MTQPRTTEDHLYRILAVARDITDNHPVDLHRLANQIERLAGAVDDYDAAMRHEEQQTPGLSRDQGIGRLIAPPLENLSTLKRR